MGVVKAVSIIVPTVKDLDRLDIRRLSDVLNNGDYKYEIILCTSSKCRGVQQSNILLTNINSSIKCGFTQKRGIVNIIKCGLDLCKYQDIIILQDSIDLNANYIKKLMYSYKSSNRDVYVSHNGLIAMSLYSTRSVLEVCKKGDILEMLNVCDYLKFNIRRVDSNGISRINFDTLVESNDMVSKYKRKREKKSFQRKLFGYCY